MSNESKLYTLGCNEKAFEPVNIDQLKQLPYNRSYIGSVYKTNEGYQLKVINGGAKRGYVTIQIENWISEKSIFHIKRGMIKYPFHASVYEIGYFGDGEYTKSNKKLVYRTWHNMIERCYESSRLIKDPAYKNVKVCKEWHNFQNFARWYESNYPKNGFKYEIDKDLKSGDIKTYSPRTCIFIPHSLNSFMANIKSSNKSEYTGVSWDKKCEKWKAEIRVNEKNKFLGLYRCIKTASRAYEFDRCLLAKSWQNFYSFDYPKSVLDRLV